MKHKTIIRFALCSLALAVIIGCGEDLSIFSETLEIDEIKLGQSSIGTGETTTMEATVYYSGDETALEYDWTVDGGEISGSGSSAVYRAPNTPGTYEIKITVTDGDVSSEEKITISVGQQSVESVILGVSTHWSADELEGKLVYSVYIDRVVSGRVTLHYKITQDRDASDAYLRIQIDQQTVLPSTAIGGQLPSTAKVTTRDLDVSGIISSPGRYIITFYIKPANRTNNGWLLNEAKLTGVQGTSDPQQ